jgi:hypothetical protein
MPEMDTLISQFPKEDRAEWAANMWLVIRTKTEPQSVMLILRHCVP